MPTKINSKNPVILVHGIVDTKRKMEQIKRFLSGLGWRVFSISLTPSTGELGIEDLAKQLSTFIKIKIKGNQRIDIIGFSMGGLVSRYYVQKLNGYKQVDRLIMISSPQRGTLLGYLSSKTGPKQMRFNSNFIQELNNNVDRLRSLKITSIWTPLDLMILPSSSSKIKFGKKHKSFMHFTSLNGKR